MGNPNVGKTTLFNALTGQNARVGNYPGVTVERRAARLELSNGVAELVDAPGAYSLSARSAEEQVAIEAALGLSGNPRPALLVVVVDAGHLTRNLYLALQLAEFRAPMVLALTMLDDVPERPPLASAVGDLFGVPCVATNPRTGTGLQELTQAIAGALEHSTQADVQIPYDSSLQQRVDEVARALPAKWKRNVEHDRGLASWALASLEHDDELAAPEALRRACAAARQSADRDGVDLDLEVVRARYDWLDQHVSRCYSTTQAAPSKPDWTERIDRYLLHPVYGFAAFVALMLCLFQALFTWTDPAIGWLEGVVTALQELANGALPPSLLTDLVVEGVLGGVGNVVVFLPQILLLFFVIGLLEDSGYMARVAYLMDRVLRGVGLHGKAFVPMLSGLACAVPAILASRTMERQRDRLLTMMVVPLMTCAARLPVYSLIIAALFPPSEVFGLVPVQGLLMIAMYVFSIVVTLLAAWVLGRTWVRGRHVPLILELPRYRWPSWPTTLRMVLQRAREFLTRAGTVILGFTIALWCLLTFPRDADVDPGALTAPHHIGQSEMAQTERSAPAIERSYAGRLGKALEPVMQPLGFDWKITIGIIGAFSAREVFVSTLGLVFGLEQTDDEALPLRDAMRAETRPDGRPAYPPLVGLSLLLFFALACQCMSTVAVVRRETRSWRWPAIMVGYMTFLAYVVSLVVYQLGVLLGFAH